MMKMELNLTLGGVKDKDFDLAQSNLTAFGKMTLGNGMVMEMQRMNYQGNGKAAMQTSCMRNGKRLGSIVLKTHLSGIPSLTLREYLDKSQQHAADFMDLKARNLKAKCSCRDK